MLANGTYASQYQELVVYGVIAPNSVQTANASGTIASGGSTGIGFSLGTGTAANLNGAQASITLSSTGVGTSGLANTSLGVDPVTVSGKIYAPAVANLSTTSINFGDLHVGTNASQTVGVTNAATGPADRRTDRGQRKHQWQRLRDTV